MKRKVSEKASKLFVGSTNRRALGTYGNVLESFQLRPESLPRIANRKITRPVQGEFTRDRG
jgi:hypothetical protein